MMKKKRNNKAGLFFVSLVLIGVIFVNLGNRASSKSEAGNNYEEEVLSPPEECTNCATQIEQEIVYEEPEPGMYIINLEEKDTVDITSEVQGGEVGGLWDSIVNFTNCNNYDGLQTLSSTMRLCPEGEATLNLDGDNSWVEELLGSNVRINSNANVELTYVSYPLAFFLGQYAWQYSTRQATTESPNYPSLGKVIDENYTLKTHSPDGTFDIKLYMRETEQRDFAVSASVSVDGENVESPTEDEEGEYRIVNADHDPTCLCEQSNWNPGSPNRGGAVGGGWARSQIPGNDPYEYEEIEQCLELEKDYEMMLFGNVPACIDGPGILKGTFNAIISKIFDADKWNNCESDPRTDCTGVGDGGDCVKDGKWGTCISEKCTIPADAPDYNQESCVDTREIGIEMSTLFGDPYECETELCANAYLTNSYKAGLSPEQADSKQVESSDPDTSLMFFIGTPCQANVEVGSREVGVPVTCLWDVSPYLLDYKLQKSTTAPNQEDFPSTFEIYWEMVEGAMRISAEVYELL